MTAWMDLVAKMWKEHKGTKNDKGEEFTYKDAMSLAKKSYHKKDGEGDKSSPKSSMKKKSGLKMGGAAMSGTGTADMSGPTKGGRRSKSKRSAKKRSSKRRGSRKSRKSMK